MNPLNRELIRYNENLYEVIKRYSENKVKAGKTDDLRQFLSCDVTLKKDGILFFCRKIEDAVIVE